ncbi:hypothetical protein B6D29_03795 [Microgenomates bacterium UTCPR1]|nr:MAG: hypothetical protein B6D29_03795 [Microgenomates bacterium UTCPR1]
MKVLIKRVYETPSGSDGKRVLVDRFWPRGLTKEKAKIDLWLKYIAPSNELRKWFGHDPLKWEEFKRRYTKEIKNNQKVFKELESVVKKGKVTILYSAKDEDHNNAVVVKELLEKSD